MAAFTVCISTTTILGVFAAIEMERTYFKLSILPPLRLLASALPAQLFYFAPLDTCVFGTKPRTIVAMLALLVRTIESLAWIDL
jgi:hypothetical protein